MATRQKQEQAAVEAEVEVVESEAEPEEEVKRRLPVCGSHDVFSISENGSGFKIHGLVTHHTLQDVLRPGYFRDAGRQGIQRHDRIELACAQLKKQLGESVCNRLVESLRKVAGDQVKGQSMISITSPGTLPAAKQKALTKVFTDLL